MRDIESSRLVIKEQLRDSTLWDAITPRKDDIVIASCYKSGTTLTQQIVNLLINKDDKFICVQEASPWVDFALFPSSPDKLEALPSPRFLKSHLPFEALPHYEGWKYIYLVRDGRDVCTSLFNHCKSHLVKTDRHGISIDNGPDDFSTFFDLWLETGKPRWDFWENVNSWWNVRHYPNVLLLHYANLLSNKAVEVANIAHFLNIQVDQSIIDMVCERSSIDYMKKNVHKFERPGSFKPNSFINKGTNGRWKNLLNDIQIERYQKVIYQKLDQDCADWVINAGECNHL